MIILSISKLNNNQFAGINVNIPKFVKELNNECYSGYLDCGEENLINFNNFDNYFKLKNYKKFSIKKLPPPFNRPDIVVFQDFYFIESIKISKELKKMGIPYTIIPRCALTYNAQQKKVMKKKIANLLLFNKFVENANFIHFLTKNEYLESNKCFKFKKYIIIGNGIDLPSRHYLVKNRSEFICTYIGRIDIYHKGLDYLLKAIDVNKSFFIENHIIVNIYGPDYDNNLQKVLNFIRNKKLDSIVQVFDGIFGEEKEKVLLDTDVFIQTSRLEGHPTGVIEAISYGIPVIVTPGTNMVEDVKNNDLGYTCEFDENSIFDAIKQSYFERKMFKLKSKNAIEFSIVNYDWKCISKKIIKSYSMLLSEGNEENEKFIG